MSDTNRIWYAIETRDRTGGSVKLCIGGGDHDEFTRNMLSMFGQDVFENVLKRASAALETDMGEAVDNLAKAGVIPQPAMQPGTGYAQAAPQAPAFVPPTQTAQTQPPVPQCAHGPMQFRSGVSAKNGKAWSAYFCPTPKGTPGQCEAIFNR